MNCVPKSLSQVILFVEGASEKEFYQALLNYYKSLSQKPIIPCKVINVKGISRFEITVAPKLKHEIIPQFHGAKLKVVCCYDTDVFELAQKPPTNWKIVEKKVRGLAIKEFYEVKAVRMIEDWFLKDIQGLCNFLKIKPIKNIDGKDGLEKIKKLFKRGNKIYQKGSNSHKFISFLNIKTIRDRVLKELALLESAINFKEHISK